MSATNNKQNNKQQNNKCIVATNKFEISRFSYTELEKDNKILKSMSIAYLRYNYPLSDTNNLVIQTRWIKLTQYGIPTLGEYYKDDNARDFMKVPFDPSQDGCLELLDVFKQIDDYTMENLGNLLGVKLAKHYSYQKLVKDPVKNDLENLESDDEDKEDQPEEKPDDKVKFQSCKLKFKSDYKTKRIETKVYVSESIDSTDRPTPVEVNTVSDIERVCPWGSHVRFLLIGSKFWAAKNKMKPSDPFRLCGVGFKIGQMQVVSGKRGSQTKDMFNEYAFGDFDDKPVDKKEESSDSDNESDDNNNKQNNTKDLVVDDDQEDQDDQDEDDEPSPPPPPKKTAATKGKTTRKGK